MNLRKEFENLFFRMCVELGEKETNISKLSDYRFLSLFNQKLVKLNCLPMNFEELEQNLY